ncbi:MAG TPA: hypothetical protein QGF58_10525 [Myxococcota bacterium]|nr:hypothetical protein [Myxococcota bacterium]
MIALFIGLAAASPQGTVWVGYDHVVNDPFLRRRGLHVGAGFAPGELVSFELSGGFYPDLGVLDWTPLTKQLVDEVHVSPDISKVIARGDLGVRIDPLSRRWKFIEARSGAHAGVGMVYTRDDLEALQAQNDPVALSTETQVHPAATVGLHAELKTDYVVGLRVKSESVRYIETVNGTTLESKALRFVGMEVVAWFP